VNEDVHADLQPAKKSKKKNKKEEGCCAITRKFFDLEAEISGPRQSASWVAEQRGKRFSLRVGRGVERIGEKEAKCHGENFPHVVWGQIGYVHRPTG
jgi:hypothetical protein